MSRLEKEFDLTAAERNEILVLLAKFLRRFGFYIKSSRHFFSKITYFILYGTFPIRKQFC